jgi:type VI secretion system Hcp family effector
MPSNMFLHIKTVDGAVAGESRVSGFEETIELSSWTWGIAHTGSAGAGSGGSTGVASVNDMMVTAPIDKSFPVLSQAAAKGTHLDECVLTVCKSGGDLLPYLKITMKGGILSNVQVNGALDASSTSLHTMNISLNFQQVDIEYTPQGAKGDGGGATTGSIDISGLK